MSTSLVPTPLTRPVAAPRRVALLRLKLFLRLLAVTLAGLQAWNGRHAINPDGVSYLDIADAYLRGDWRAAVSTYWSPLYSWLLAGGMALLRPSPYWEFAALKVVNVAIFLAVLPAFEWLLHEAMRLRHGQEAAPTAGAVPEGVFIAVAYGLFLWSSCVLTSLDKFTPDLLVSLFVYLAAAWVLRARRIAPGWKGSLIFGLILGTGCLAKTAVLPLGLLFLLVSLASAGSLRKAVLHIAVVAVVMAVVFGGFVGAMYARSGRVTLGDASRLNYVWLVNGVPDHGWESDDSRLGTAIHPPRRLPSEPPVFEFAAPVAGTSPLWYDPSYWAEGLTWRFDLRQQLAAVFQGLRAYVDLFLHDMAPLTAALVLLHLGAWLSASGTHRARLAGLLRTLAGEYPLLIPGLGACALYALVVVEPRYLTGFVVLLGLGVLRAVRFPSASEVETTRWSWAAAVVLVLAPAVGLALQQGFRGAEAAVKREPGAYPDWQVVQELQRRGVHAGDRVGVVGDPFDCGWARAGRLRIVAEVRTRDTAAFWTADAARQGEVLDAFRKAGVVAVVARAAPESSHDWQHMPGAEYAVQVLRGPGGP